MLSLTRMPDGDGGFSVGSIGGAGAHVASEKVPPAELPSTGGRPISLRF